MNMLKHRWRSEGGNEGGGEGPAGEDGEMEAGWRVGGLAQCHPGGGELMNSERLRGQATRCLI